jgi:hypothetical protein
MEKVNPIFYAGLEFVHISSLPAIQYEFLNKHIPSVRRIKLTIGEEQIENCITYQDYEHWYYLIDPQHFDNYFESQI